MKKNKLDTDAAILTKLKLQVKESYSKTQKPRDEAKTIKKYFKGEQLPDEVLEILNSRDQPIEYENIIKKIANKIIGLKLLSKQEINAFARQTNDKDAASIITNVLRASQDSTNFWSYKKRADKDLLLTGVSIMKPVIKELGEVDILGSKERDLRYYHVPMEQAFWDPYFTSPDASDSRYFHEVRMLEKEDLYEYFEEELVDALTVYKNDTSEYGAETTDYSQRVKIIYSWYKQYDKKLKRNVIFYAIWSDDVLLAHKASPYNMNRIPVSIRKVYDADADDPTLFYSIFRDIMPMQDRINYTHLRIANMMGSVKMLFESDAVEDAETFMEEYSQDDAIVEVNSGAIKAGKLKEIKHNNDIAQLMNIISDKRLQAEEIIGLNSELSGTSVQRLSGYAIENRQNAGMIGLQLFIDASLQQDRDLADMGVSLITQYVNAEQIYRIVDGFEADNYFKVNEVETTNDGRVIFEDGKVKRKNKLEIGRYDIILKSVPQSRGSIGERQKNWVEIMKLFAGNANILEKLLPRMLRDVESPVAQEVLQVIKEEQESKANNPQINEMQQLQAKELALKLDRMQKEIEKLSSITNVNNENAAKIKKENEASA